MVPKYCFRCEVTYRNGAALVQRTSNHELLAAAMEARNKALSKTGTIRVVVVSILDETSKGQEHV